MRDASTPKLNLATKIFHVDSFVVLFSFFLKFDLMFSSNLFDKLKHVKFFKKFYQTYMFHKHITRTHKKTKTR